MGYLKQEEGVGFGFLELVNKTFESVKVLLVDDQTFVSGQESARHRQALDKNDTPLTVRKILVPFKGPLRYAAARPCIIRLHGLRDQTIWCVLISYRTGRKKRVELLFD
jgi:hypothetical protein